MAVDATTARRASWERAFSRYIELNLQLQGTADLTEGDTFVEALAKQADELMELRAPNLTAVLQKLYVLWGETDLHGLDRDSEEKRLILEDLERLIDDAAQLIVMSPDHQPVRTLGLWPSPPPASTAG